MADTIHMNKDSGFTLIELMVAVTVLAIIMAFGLPQLSGILQSNRNVASINSLSGILAYARSQAVTLNTAVSVVPNVGADWLTGWTVTVDATAENLRISRAPNVVDVTIRGPISVTFNPNGSANASTIQLCRGANATTARAINISAIGTIQTARDTNADPNIVNDVTVLMWYVPS